MKNVPKYAKKKYTEWVFCAELLRIWALSKLIDIIVRIAKKKHKKIKPKTNTTTNQSRKN